MKKFAEKPFALIGIHLKYDGEEASKVKEVMVKENLNWRTFVDRGAIAETWKPAGTPSFFIIDPQGVIRHKWAGAPGAKAIDTALEKLIQNASPLFSESFDDQELLKRAWYDGSRFAIVGTDGDDAQPYAGKGCIEYRWNAGTTNPASSSGVRHLFEPSDTVYLRCSIKLSKGWGWSGRSYHPHLMHFMTTENEKFAGPAATHLTVYIEPCNGKLRLAAQDIQNKDSPHGLTQGALKGGYNGQFFDSKDELFKDDAWHCVEAMFQLNSLDLKTDKPKADGIVRGWFDGKLVIDRTNVILRSTDFPRMKFNQFLLTPYFGPGLLPHAQTLWIDELAVGTTRLGPVKAK